MIVAYLGDTVATFTSHPSLDKDDPILMHYVVHFRDVPTGRIAEIAVEGENDAVMLIAAWLAADESDIGVLEKFRAQLQEKAKFFMP